MMDQTLTDKAVRDLPPPAAGNRITYDADVRGFGVRVTAAGAKAFVLNYRVNGRERRITIGDAKDWTVKGAREQAKALKRRTDLGEDPLAERNARREAPTVNELADRFETEHLAKRRPTTAAEYRSILKTYIRPRLGSIKVADLQRSDVERLHSVVSARAPYRANRALSILSKMFTLAIGWGMRTDNPARGIERAPEAGRDRYLDPAAIRRLADALAVHPERASCNAISLLMLTGARKGETLAARWGEFDLVQGVWTKPSAHTKQKRIHRVPVSGPALALLRQMKAEKDKVNAGKRLDQRNDLVFDGGGGKPLRDIKRAWAAVCRTAGLGVYIEAKDAAGRPKTGPNGQPMLVWKSDTRLHDLRHTFASILASGGLSLPVIGRLLGHTQSATTARYAHLLDDPLREATERVGAVVARTTSAHGS